MKIFFVSGGKYKSFYLNAFLKVKNYDLLVINFGILYDIVDLKRDLDLIINELKNLSKKANVPVVAGVKIGEKLIKKIVVCEKENYRIFSIKSGLNIKIKNKSFIIGGEFTNYTNNNKIILTEKRIYPEIKHCSKKKIYIFCDNFGITKVENAKISRKFYKYAKIILK